MITESVTGVNRRLMNQNLYRKVGFVNQECRISKQINIENCRIETMNVYEGFNSGEFAAIKSMEGIMTEIEALKQEVKRVKQQFKAMEKERDLEIAALTAEIIRLREKTGEKDRGKDCKQVLFNIGKWSVQKGKDGYYRMFRRHKGRVCGVYLGKYPSPEMAQERAWNKERELGMNNDS